MRGFHKFGTKPVFWLVAALLLTLAAAVPAYAGIGSVTVGDYNPTVYAASDYTLDFAADDAGLSVGEAVYVDIDETCFGCGEIDLNSVKLTAGGSVYSGQASWDSEQACILEIPIVSAVPGGSSGQIVIKGVTNPESLGEYCFAVVYSSAGYDEFEQWVTMDLPVLIVEPEYAEVVMNVHDKITIALEDQKGQPFAAPYDIGVNLYNDNAYDYNPNLGEFYLEPGGASLSYPSFAIPQGSSETSVYYMPYAVSGEGVTHKIGTNSISFAGGTLSAVSPEIKVVPAGGVEVLVAECPECFVAGTAGKVTVMVVDQYDNPVEQSAPLEVKLGTYVGEEPPGPFGGEYSSPTGKFYLGVNEDGTGQGEPVVSVTIPAGSSIASVYYCDTKATGPDYQLWLGARYGEMNWWTWNRVCVEPAKASKISLKIEEPDEYQFSKMVEKDGETYEFEYRLKVTDLGQEPKDLLSGMPFQLRVALVDDYGNPVQPAGPLTVSLSVEDLSGGNVGGTFHLLANDGWAPEPPATQVTFDNGIYFACGCEYPYPERPGEVLLDFVGSGNGPAVIKASAPGLDGGALEVNLIPADRLRVVLPVVKLWDESAQEEVEIEVPSRLPERRYVMAVFLTDAKGRPAKAKSDICIALSDNSAGGAFFLDSQSLEPVSGAVIPAGCEYVLVFYQTPSLPVPASELAVEITASSSEADGLLSGSAAVTVAYMPCFWRCLAEGWNTLSTPVLLDNERGRDEIDQVLKGCVDKVEIAFVYSEADSCWYQICGDSSTGYYINKDLLDGKSSTDPEFRLKPLEAIYVKMSEPGEAVFYPANYASAPPERELAAGWNLIGPAFINTEIIPALKGCWFMPVSDVMSSLSRTGEYSQVVSPNLGRQRSWVYVPGSDECSGDWWWGGPGEPYWWFEPYNCCEPPMEAGMGYWVYVTEPGTLAGFSSTPVW